MSLFFSIRSTASSCSATIWCSLVASRVPSASIASFDRIPATRCRSVAAARTAAAAGLFSSWVSPADKEPRASNRSRSPTVSLVRRMPITKPSIRCTAIGNQVFIIVAIVSASMTKKSDGSVTRIVAV